MLNKNWKKEYKETDWGSWNRVRSIAPDMLYYAMQYINYLLGKYYRTKHGEPISKLISDKAKYYILERTMNELAQALEYEQREKNPTEETEETRLQREEDLYERGHRISFRKIGLIIEKEGFWISPKGEIYTIGPNQSHSDWLKEHKDILGIDIGVESVLFKKALLAGWVRLRFDEDDETGKSEVDITAKDFHDAISIIPHELIDEIKKRQNLHFMDVRYNQIEIDPKTYDFEHIKEPMSIAAKLKIAPNPIRLNEDYGMDWINRVKKYISYREI